MPAVERLSPEEAKTKVSTGEALLVCAYESDEKFVKNHLEGAISSSEFYEMLTSVSDLPRLVGPP